jgi:hypothetical protein
VDVYEVDLLYGGNVERDNIESWRPSLTPSKSRYSEGGSTARLIRLSRGDRRVVAESTTIISVWANIIDIVIKGLFVWSTSVPFTVNGTNVVKTPNTQSIVGTLILGTLTLQRYR